MGLFDDGRTRAFKAQLKALEAPRYRVTVQTPDDRVQVAVLPAGDLLRQERWLRGQNEVGAQVRLRPAEPTGLVLVGPLSGRQRAALEEEGFPGALVTTLGADRYEVWVRLEGTPLPRGLEEALAQALNFRYTDSGAYGAPPAGSLAAGLEDPRDPWTRSADGQGVYVSVVAHSRGIAPGAVALRDRLLEHMRLPQDYFYPLTRAQAEHERGDHDQPHRGLVETRAHPPVEEHDPGEDDWGLVATTPAHDEAHDDREDDPSENLAPVNVLRAISSTPAEPPAPQDAALAEQFATLREQILSRNRKGLDARQAEFAAAHQLVRAHPDLTTAELRQALDQGGATGQGTAGLPSDRAAYIARTAERVLAQPQRPTPEAHATGVER